MQNIDFRITVRLVGLSADEAKKKIIDSLNQTVVNAQREDDGIVAVQVEDLE